MKLPDPNNLRAQGTAMLDQYWLDLAAHQREVMRIAMYGPADDDVDKDLCRMMALVCITEILTRQNARELDASDT